MLRENKKKIALCSYTFWPILGGLETFSQLLAEYFLKKGHEVVLITTTLYNNKVEPFPYKLFRNPDTISLLKVYNWADVVIFNHPSLRLGWPLFFIKKKYLIIVQNWLSFKGIKGFLLRHFLQGSTSCVAISQSIADHLPIPSQIIPNCYDDNLFFSKEESVERETDLLFVGRMEIDKGPLDLARAIKILNEEGLKLSASFVGYGPAEKDLQAYILEQRLEKQVSILGKKEATEVAEIMRKHKILVVPSIWQEPFGIVALEGIACGCFVIGSSGGGLKEAIGHCGLLYSNGDFRELARLIKEVISHFDSYKIRLQNVNIHLEKFKKEKIGYAYGELLDKIFQTPIETSL
ncbi:glycosyltransferase family 4 protein [Methylacidiphilum caldifontis]|uniref:Glycosyl transferase family 1 domain-containing protein n=1 Tax=Methylacidiphilum caldifontis TaxID=2795386 RepID=A0A4Y8PAQ2_9BACT|nr:glycosyltransferase family 4 protein [Methylacidiphilum caldifontis]TFE66581.1 hypothetical protein A7Q10_02055 [Methylacidiphilum caldifontis]